ncbi:MAG: hypothetical protein FWE21_03205 [Defluviitaleaceae bacterium]|nr:hypothetical protein [Defluviitaleaceae bacterium]
MIATEKLINRIETLTPGNRNRVMEFIDKIEERDSIEDDEAWAHWC